MNTKRSHESEIKAMANEMYRVARFNKLNEMVEGFRPTEDVQEAFALKRKLETLGGTYKVQKVTQAYLDKEARQINTSKAAHEARRPAWKDGE